MQLPESEVFELSVICGTKDIRVTDDGDIVSFFRRGFGGTYFSEVHCVRLLKSKDHDELSRLLDVLNNANQCLFESKHGKCLALHSAMDVSNAPKCIGKDNPACPERVLNGEG